MWQKLSRIDIYELEKARIQLINAIQLVSAASRSYLDNFKENHLDWLMWNVDTSSMVSNSFGTNEKTHVELDIEGFVLSIYGKKDHAEHLVLSGITYPLAFGWMKIKLDTFHLSGEKFNDNFTYSIGSTLGPNDEMNVSNQKVFGDLVVYLSNAYHVFNTLKEDLDIGCQIFINPENMNLVFLPEAGKFSFGFSPGDNVYLEPYFYFQIDKITEKLKHELTKPNEIWNSKSWNGLVCLADEIIASEQESEERRVISFFKINYSKLLQN
jgi:hypothetical protein